MKRKLPSTISKFLPPVIAIAVSLAVWQGVCMAGWVPSFMLPSPVQVVQALVKDFPLLASHAGVTLLETFIGMTIGILIGFVLALLMDRYEILLVLWFGYEMLPKIILIVLVVFFPVAVTLLDGYQSVDRDTVNLLRSMGADDRQVFRYVKFPAALGQFFAGLKIAVSYAVVSAVIAEWLGGFNGLGVYMTRVKKAYSFDKMFAVIFLISALSLILMWIVKILQKKFMPWENLNKESK